MADPNFMTRYEPVIGDEDPIYANTFDRANKEMYDWFSREHDDSGAHTAVSSLCVVESGIFAGNGANRTIQLKNQYLDVCYLEIYCSDTMNGTYLLMATASMPSGKTKRCVAEGFTENEITALGHGTFSVGTSNFVNASGTGYYYFAWGTMSGFESGAGDGTYEESEIDWIQHGEDIEVSDSPQLATDPMTRQSYQMLTKWRQKHLDNGKHMSFPGLGINIELVTFAGDGGVSQVVSLFEISTIQKMLILWDDDVVPIVKTSNMSVNAMKYMNATALDTNGYVTFGSKNFTVQNLLNVNEQEYYAVIWGV